MRTALPLSPVTNRVAQSCRSCSRQLCPPVQALRRRGSTQGTVRRPPPTQAPQEQSRPEYDEAAQQREVEEMYAAQRGDDDDMEDFLREMNPGPPNMRQSTGRLLRSDFVSEKTGESQQMEVEFREISPFDLWLWIEVYRPMLPEEFDMLSEVVTSWFLLGRLGAFNGQNMQVYWQADDGISHMDYDSDACDTDSSALFHDMSSMERQGNWVRCWVNMGTADEFALDMLINALSTFSKENVGIKKLCVGGINENWPIPQEQLPEASMDPMSITASPIDDDFDMRNL